MSRRCHDSYRTATCSSPCATGVEQGERTAAVRLSSPHTFPLLDVGSCACPVWTPGHALMNTGAPTPSVPRLRRRTPRAGKCLNRTRWTRSGFGLRVARLDPLSRACGLGARGVAPHAEPSAWGPPMAATTVNLSAISARLPPAAPRPGGPGALCWAAAGRLAPLLRRGPQSGLPPGHTRAL